VFESPKRHHSFFFSLVFGSRVAGQGWAVGCGSAMVRAVLEDMGIMDRLAEAFFRGPRPPRMVGRFV
jgi:hypothetical protein